MELVEFCVLIPLKTVKLCKKFVIQNLYHLASYIPMYILVYIHTHTSRINMGRPKNLFTLQMLVTYIEIETEWQCFLSGLLE